MYKKICIFAGTTEGRELAQKCRRAGLDTLTCVATEYGGSLLEPGGSLRVSAKRLEQAQMEELFSQEAFACVVDATHPYAPVVTRNIQAACARTGTGYVRLLRETCEAGQALYVSSTEEAIAMLETLPGNILLTTGSKEIGKYAALSDFAQRVYARVLSVPESLESCRTAGLPAAHTIAMQGPFTTELNAAMLQALDCRILVTKDGGIKGGFPQKAEAAHRVGATLLVIGRPPQVEGKTLRQVAAMLGLEAQPRVAVVGIGPGGWADMTQRAQEAIRHADCLIGAKRMLEAVANPGQHCVEAIAPESIAAAIQENTQAETFAVVMAGDIGFFSGTKKLLPLLENCIVEKIPGLSSMSVLCARLGVSYETVTPYSLHGRQGNICGFLRRHSPVFVLVGGSNGMQRLCQELTEGGMGSTQVAVGERLGYPEEKLTTGTASQLCDCSFDSLSVALLTWEQRAPVTFGLPDEMFQRGAHADGSKVPMTKREIRCAGLSHLELTRDALCWDIGAGTGSVSIEMALLAELGQVYAVEKKKDALALLEENCRRFQVQNLHIVPGEAPEACKDLPAPTHVFIGGSSGQMEEIFRLALEKNPRARIVATAIALETVAELTRLQKAFAQTDCLSISVANARKAGSYQLMVGQNPVYVFTFQGNGEPLVPSLKIEEKQVTQ